MHDPTEGGVVTGCVELAAASGVDLIVERESVPIRPETAAICEAIGVDPLRIFGSGALLATVPSEAVDTALNALDRADIDAAVIGEVRESSGDDNDDGALVLDGERITTAPTDQLYPLWEDVS
jgi:hydrogenase expression/formation protein HypE